MHFYLSADLYGDRSQLTQENVTILYDTFGESKGLTKDRDSRLLLSTMESSLLT